MKESRADNLANLDSLEVFNVLDVASQEKFKGLIQKLKAEQIETMAYEKYTEFIARDNAKGKAKARKEPVTPEVLKGLIPDGKGVSICWDKKGYAFEGYHPEPIGSQISSSRSFRGLRTELGSLIEIVCWVWSKQSLAGLPMEGCPTSEACKAALVAAKLAKVGTQYTG